MEPKISIIMTISFITHLSQLDAQPYLAPAANTETSQQGTQTQRMVIDAYVTAILEQPIITLDDVPDLAQHMQEAQSHATYWNTTVREGLIQTNTSLINFCNQWDSYYNTLYQEAENLSEGDNLANFIVGINLLIAAIDQQEQGATAALADLQTYQSEVLSDQSNFNSDLQTANEAYEGDQGEINQLQEAADAQQTAMNRDLSIIGLGATVDVVSGLAIVVGLLGEIETAGVSTALVVAGLIGIAGGTTAAGLAIADYEKQASAYADTIQKIAEDTDDMAALTSMTSQINSLVQAGDTAVGAIQGMVNSWQTLNTEFNSVVTDLEAIDTPEEAEEYGIYLTAQLSTANQEWQRVKATAEYISLQLTNLPVTQKDSSNS